MFKQVGGGGGGGGNWVTNSTQIRRAPTPRSRDGADRAFDDRANIHLSNAEHFLTVNTPNIWSVCDKEEEEEKTSGKMRIQ